MAPKDKKYSSLALMCLVRESQSTRGAQRTLLSALALRSNPKNSNCCWPSYKTLAWDTRLDVITLRRAAAALERAGLITRHQRQLRSNIFRLNIPVLEKHAAEGRALREKRLDGETAEMLERFKVPVGDEDDDPSDHAADDAGDDPGDYYSTIVKGGR